MPRKCHVETLLSKLLLYFRKTIVKTLRNHKSLNCKYCKNNYLNEDCLNLKSLKDSLTDIPGILKETLYDDVLKLLYGDDIDSRSTEHLHFLTWMLETKDLQIVSYVSLEDMADWHFMKKYGKYIYVIKFYGNPKYLNIDCRNNNMSQARNVQILKFVEPFITEDIAQVIGRHCSILKEIYGAVSNYGFITSVYEMLLIPDGSGSNCCKTLQVINIRVRSDHYWDYKPLVHNEQIKYLASKQVTLKLLFDNVPNLKHTGNVFTLEEMVLALNPKPADFVTQIEESFCSEPTMQMVDRIKQIFPHLKKLSIDFLHINLDVLRALGFIETITAVVGYCNGDKRYTKEGIYAIMNYPTAGAVYNPSGWSNLTSFSINAAESITFPRFHDINFSHFASYLPRLEHLHVDQCCSIMWDNESRFKSLKYVTVNIQSDFADEDNYIKFDWLGSFSETIVEIALNADSGFDPGDVLKMNRFPKLEKMLVRHSLKYDIDDVIEFINSCEEIQYFGTVMFNKDSDEWKKLQKYLDENNINCYIYGLE